MKIAAMLSGCEQIGMDAFRDRHITKIFDSKDSFDDVLRWAKTINEKNTLSDILLSEVV